MRGTKLRQSAGSPLISGSSRYDRPFLYDWLRAWAVAFMLGYATVVAAMVQNGIELETALRTAWMPGLPASALGALAAVWFSRRMGWKRSWLLGGILGVLLAAGATAGFVALRGSGTSG